MLETIIITTASEDLKIEKDLEAKDINIEELIDGTGNNSESVREAIKEI